MSTYLVLGGSGRTGQLIVAEALARGHRVHALVRNPASLQPAEGLEIFTGTPEEVDAIAAAAGRTDGVLFALNNSRASDAPWAKSVSPRNFMTDAMRNTLKVMGLNGIKRIVAISAVGAGDSWRAVSPLFRAIVRFTNIRHSYNDHNGVDAVIRASDADWTLLRAVTLSDKTDRRTVHAANSGAGGEQISHSIGRADLARFALEVIERDLWVREAPTVWSSD